jgi:DNA-binding response OmpR family regulator
MANSWRGMMNGILERTGELWLQWERFASGGRTVLAVTRDCRCKTSLHILSLEQGWRILFAESLEDGLRLEHTNRICVLIYDRDLTGVEWREGLRALLSSDEPLLPIVISDAPSAELRSEVIDNGGFDLARNPLEPDCFVALVNGALALAESIDSLES